MHCVTTPSDEVFAVLCDRLGRPELAADPRFAGAIDRLLHRPALDEELGAAIGTRTTAELIDLLGGDVPVGPVNDMAAIYADPHVVARDMLVEVEQPDGSRPVTLAGQPIKMTRSRTGIRARPPRLGEHTDDVMAEAGIDR